MVSHTTSSGRLTWSRTAACSTGWMLPSETMRASRNGAGMRGLKSAKTPKVVNRVSRSLKSAL